MPLSDHEQRMLDQIESALYAEDPKFASSVRGGTLRAPSARRRLQGAALFVIGLAMLVVRRRVQGHHDRKLPDSVGDRVRRDVRRRGVRDHRPAGDRRPRSLGLRTGERRGRSAPRAPAARSPAGWRIGSAAASTNSVQLARNDGVAPARSCPVFCRGSATVSPHIAPLPALGGCHLRFCADVLRRPTAAAVDETRGEWAPSGDMTASLADHLEQSGELWGKVADNGATGAPE